MDNYEQDRLKKLQAIRDLGLDPYGGTIQDSIYADVAVNIAWASRKIEGGQIVPRNNLTPQNGPEMQGFGRIVLRREMGNLHFLTIRDHTGEVQVALNKKMLQEQGWKLAKQLDIGDQIYFSGRAAPTQKGEPTLWATHLSMGAKMTLPPPAKHEGMTDVELRYRKRYVDLWSNPEAAKVLVLRSRIIQGIRETLYAHDFMEVETPMMQTIAGGAAAQPFVTHHKALGIPLFLRIAPELYLKRLLVGGFPRIFEIGRNFRNEGISTKHNPEFTALELYQSYSDHEQMMQMVETIVNGAVHEMDRKTPKTPWRRIKMTDLCKEFIVKGQVDGIFVEPSVQPATIEQWHEYYEAHVEHTLIEPTFVTHLPASVVPLAKSDGHGNALAFEFVAGGMEIGCGYTEQTDPAVQLEVLMKQSGDDVQKIDHDFIDALKVGMPPSGGLGIGIDRLVMWMTGATSVRDVILFPTMKPITGEDNG